MVRLLADRPFRGGEGNGVAQLARIVLLPPRILLDDIETDRLDALVRREAAIALLALAPPPDTLPAPQLTRVNHPRVRRLTEWAPHLSLPLDLQPAVSSQR